MRPLATCARTELIALTVEPVLTMRQQLVDATCRMRGQALENVPEVDVRIVPIDPSRVHQAHHRRGAFARPQAAGEQPVGSADGNRWVILPMSGKKLRSSTAGTRCTGDA